MSDQPQTTPPSTTPQAPATPSSPAPAPTAVSTVPAAPQHELTEPTDGLEPIPMWMVGFFGILLFWGGWYLAQYAGDWRSSMLEEDPAALRTVAATSTAVEDPMLLGKRIFTANCAVCHQPTGLGVPGQYPPLVGSDWLAGNPARIKRLVLHGGEGAITVKGTVYNNAMPPFGAKLSDKQIAAVLTFERGNPEWGNSAPPISPESVAATRAATKGRIDPWNPAELLTIDTDEGPAPTSTPTTTAATSAPASTTTPSGAATTTAP